MRAVLKLEEETPITCSRLMTTTMISEIPLAIIVIKALVIKAKEHSEKMSQRLHIKKT